MVLKEYFKDKPRGSKSMLARDLGVSRTWLALIISGRRRPSAALCVEIERRTGVLRQNLRPDLFGGI
jgi:DNA-binding transcriptional regulator YdaS (Cro superfamily)